MTQPDWLKNILSRFDSVEEKIGKQSQAGELSNRVQTLESELSTARGELATAQNTIKERDEKISSLTGDLEKAQNAAKESDGKIKAAEEKAAAAEKTAQELLASQGLDPATLPAGGEPKNESTEKQVTELRKRLAASTDGKEKFTLSNQIRELTSKKN